MYDLAAAQEMAHRAVALARSLRVVCSARGDATANGVIVEMGFARPLDRDGFEVTMEALALKYQRHNLAGDIEVLEGSPEHAVVRLGRPMLKQQRAGGFGHSAPAPGRHNNGDW